MMTYGFVVSISLSLLFLSIYLSIHHSIYHFDFLGFCIQCEPLCLAIAEPATINRVERRK